MLDKYTVFGVSMSYILLGDYHSLSRLSIPLFLERISAGFPYEAVISYIDTCIYIFFRRLLFLILDMGRSQ